MMPSRLEDLLAERLAPVIRRGRRARLLTGEVQTPLCGDAAADLTIGDRAYLRHAKAGELCERFNALHLVEGNEIVDVVPTYRGDGQNFL
jgi:D-serine deaminase-like pyridoxal phosphate-dependent protein